MFWTKIKKRKNNTYSYIPQWNSSKLRINFQRLYKSLQEVAYIRKQESISKMRRLKIINYRYDVDFISSKQLFLLC